ncbi:MAG: hypothetical protein JAY71_19325, partial [Candidatus Thiodiazotropha weberae]|nr:hypothetical protein [Candidatus Thiodiazotropha weberae]
MKGKHEPGEVGYEFFSRRSGEICREILALATPKHRTELVLKRVELLREHERFCQDPQVRARFSRVIRY